LAGRGTTVPRTVALFGLQDDGLKSLAQWLGMRPDEGVGKGMGV